MPIYSGTYSSPGGWAKKSSSDAFQTLGDTFGLGGGGKDQNFLADYLRSIGIDIPGGMSARGFGKGQLLSQLLQMIQSPTGLEGFYGQDFENRAIGTSVARTAQPFAEAGRSLTSGFLRGGGGTPGALTEARGRLAQGQAQTAGSSIQDLLLGLEGQRAGNVESMEGIRQNRLSLLANYLNRLATQHQEGKAAKAGQQAAQGQAVGQGVGSLIPLLALLLCVVAEELFGVEDERTTMARVYMTTLAPSWLRDGYLEHGPEIVEAVKADFGLREALVPLFEWFAEKAKEALAGGV